MDFDKPKVYGDTSITDGLVNFRIINLHADSEQQAISIFGEVAWYSAAIARGFVSFELNVQQATIFLIYHYSKVLTVQIFHLSRL